MHLVYARARRKKTGMLSVYLCISYQATQDSSHHHESANVTFEYNSDLTEEDATVDIIKVRSKTFVYSVHLSSLLEFPAHLAEGFALNDLPDKSNRKNISQKNSC